jgi:hypothetical protein
LLGRHARCSMNGTKTRLGDRSTAVGRISVGSSSHFDTLLTKIHLAFLSLSSLLLIIACLCSCSLQPAVDACAFPTCFQPTTLIHSLTLLGIPLLHQHTRALLLSRFRQLLRIYTSVRRSPTDLSILYTQLPQQQSFESLEHATRPVHGHPLISIAHP